MHCVLSGLTNCNAAFIVFIENTFFHYCCCTWQFWFECTNETSPTIAVITKTWFIKIILQKNFQRSVSIWILNGRSLGKNEFRRINDLSFFIPLNQFQQFFALKIIFHSILFGVYFASTMRTLNGMSCSCVFSISLFEIECAAVAHILSVYLILWCCKCPKRHRSPNKHCIFYLVRTNSFFYVQFYSFE